MCAVLAPLAGWACASVDPRPSFRAGYVAMGSTGMAEHAAHAAMGHMPGLPNTLPMMTGRGPFGNIEMGGMFTVIKIREGLAGYDRDPGWYDQPEGTVAWKVGGETQPPGARTCAIDPADPRRSAGCGPRPPAEDRATIPAATWSHRYKLLTVSALDSLSPLGRERWPRATDAKISSFLELRS